MWSMTLTKFPSRSKYARKKPYSSCEKSTGNSQVVPAGSVPSSGKLNVPRSGGVAAADELSESDTTAPRQQASASGRIELPSLSCRSTDRAVESHRLRRCGLCQQYKRWHGCRIASHDLRGTASAIQRRIDAYSSVSVFRCATPASYRLSPEIGSMRCRGSVPASASQDARGTPRLVVTLPRVRPRRSALTRRSDAWELRVRLEPGDSTARSTTHSLPKLP